MRDYPNGGFFFLDAAPIQAAGESGLKINGIFEDAKRAIAGGKVFVLTGLVSGDDALTFSGVVMFAYEDAGAIIAETNVSGYMVNITSADVVTISV